MIKYFVILFGFIIFIPLLLTNSANACQYITSDNTIKEDFDTYDFIFSGKILKVEPPNDYTLITLEVIDQWKGQHNEKVLLFTCKGENDGGLQFKEGESYLIFAEKLNSAYPIVKDFGPTKILSDAKNDILFLDQKSHITRFHYDQPIESAPTKIRLDSPLKQIKSGISIDKIQCKETLVLIQKHDGSPVCVKSETVPKLTQRGWILSELKPESEVASATPDLEFKSQLTVEGLNQTYNVGEKIEFTVKFDGIWHGCGVPGLKIEDAHHQPIWEGNLVTSICNPDMKKDHIKKEWVVNDDSNLGVPVIDKEGFYTLFVTFADNTILNKIIISENPNIAEQTNSRPIFSNEIIIPKGSSNSENKINVFPQALTIYLKNNHSVIWSNLDDVSSTFVADDQSWTTGIIKPGESISTGFNHTGVFNFHGEPHPWQKGTIIVK